MHRTPPLELVLVALAGSLVAACGGPTPLDVQPQVPAGDRPPTTAPTSPPVMALPVPAAPTPTKACPDPGQTRVRRLTDTELGNTYRDLLGLSDALIPTEAPRWLGTFDRVAADGAPVGSTQVAAWAETAERLAGQAVADLERLLPCERQDRSDDCADRFLTVFGRRAFRRPIGEDERQIFLTLFRDGKAAGDFAEGIRWTIEAMLSSPQFLYHLALGEGAPSPAGVVRLTQHEIAARLSYALWATMPDEALMARADIGALTGEGLRSEAKRMLSDHRARSGIAHFTGQWLGTRRVERFHNPPFGPPFQTALRQSAERFVDHVLWEADGRLETLLRSPTMFAHPDGEPERYGLPRPAGPAMVKAAAPPGQRAGILTQPAVLLSAWSGSSNPVQRGADVQRQLLCREIPPPPDDLDFPEPSVPPNATTRELVMAVVRNAACQSCHRMMEPVGFAFERYDALGVYRTMENGKPVDASGFIAGLPGEPEVAFTDVEDFTAKLAGLRQTRVCASTQWFRYALGRDDGKEDACTIEALTAQLEAAGGDLRTLFVDLVTTAPFTTRRAPQGGTP